MKRLFLTKVNPWLAWTIIALAVALTLVPLKLMAEGTTGSGLVPCGFGPKAGPGDCDFNDLLVLAKNVMKFILYSLMLPGAVILIVWAGGKMVWYSSSPGKIDEAKGTLKNVAIGIFIAFAAYVIIQQSLSFFISDKPDNPINQAGDRVFRDQP